MLHRRRLACIRPLTFGAVTETLALMLSGCKSEWGLIFSLLLLAGPSCPPHSHYELCGSSCPATCRGRAVPEGCASVLCTEGCFCDEGFVLSGDECVPAGECGCEHRDRYYKKGEDFYASCRERCRCKANGVVECEEVFCSAHEECRVEDGVLGCYPAGYGRLVVSGDPHYVTFDGRAFDLLGSCTYVLARLCKPEPRLTNFSVLLEHDVGGRGNVALMKKVVISIHGYTVSVERGRKWEVTVSRESPAPRCTRACKIRGAHVHAKSLGAVIRAKSPVHTRMQNLLVHVKSPRRQARVSLSLGARVCARSFGARPHAKSPGACAQNPLIQKLGCPRPSAHTCVP